MGASIVCCVEKPIELTPMSHHQTERAMVTKGAPGKGMNVYFKKDG